MDANGNEFVMRGVNYSYAWQQGNEGTVIPAAKNQKCNTIRIQISDGTQWTKTTSSEISTLISLCEANKLVCVLNVQDELGKNDIASLEKAANYWISVKDAIIGHESTVIVNIENEWDATWESSTWAEGYETVIPMLRNAGIKNTLMVDCAGYGQYADAIWTTGSSVLAADALSNTMFSIHMYEYASYSDPTTPSGSKVKSSINSALGVGAPLVIGEFAYKGSNGYVDYQTIMDYCTEKNVGYLGWSWTGNSSDISFMDMFSGYDDSNMETNGTIIFKGTNGIQSTSKVCSVYSNSSAKTVTKIGNISSDDDIDMSKTYDIYTINGHKVQNMDEHNVYILRQNGKTKKIIK